MNTDDIASVCHEANRQLTRCIKDVPVQPSWEECGIDMQQSAVDGVFFNLANPDAPTSASHDNWCRARVEAGWTFGTVKDIAMKRHPALVPYDELPENVKRKDKLFQAIVRALR